MAVLRVEDFHWEGPGGHKPVAQASTYHLYSWYGSKKLCFLQTPSKNEQNKKTKKQTHAKNSEDM